MWIALITHENNRLSTDYMWNKIEMTLSLTEANRHGTLLLSWLLDIYLFTISLCKSIHKHKLSCSNHETKENFICLLPIYVTHNTVRNYDRIMYYTWCIIHNVSVKAWTGFIISMCSVYCLLYLVHLLHYCHIYMTIYMTIYIYI